MGGGSHPFPLTDAVGTLDRALLTDGAVTSPWGMGGLVPLIVTSVAYLGAGILVFGAGERIAKRQGTLGRH